MDKMIDVDYYTINEIDYIVVKKIEFNGKKFVYLANENNPKDVMVRRVENDGLFPLDSEEELTSVLKEIVK